MATRSAKLDQIAQLAGVSSATISRAINGQPGVSPEKSQEIHALVERMGFKVRRRRKRDEILAESRASVRDSKKAIAVLQCDDGYLASTDLFLKQLKGITEACSHHGINVILSLARDIASLPPALSAKEVDGVLLFGGEPPSEILQQIADIPTVWLASHSELPAKCVMGGNEEAGALAARYLCERKHKVLGVWNPFFHSVMEIRQKAFIKEAQSLGAEVRIIGHGEIPLPEENDKAPRAYIEHMMPFVKELIGLRKRPSGLFVADDSITAHLYPLLIQNGIVPQKELSLVSFGNKHSYLAGLNPRPPTIDIAPELLGKQVVEHLCWRMRHPEEQRGIRVSIQPVIID